jgi:hypothetical protein
MTSFCLKAAAAAACLALVAPAALAASALDLGRLSPQQRVSHVKAQNARASAPPEYNYDIRPAVLRKVQLTRRVNAAQRHAEVVLSFVANDNMTGVLIAYATLQSPTGQMVSATWGSTFPQTRTESQMSFDLSNATSNGAWQLVELTLLDANNNASTYDPAQLAALGAEPVEVVRAQGDGEAPALASGGMTLTPTVSRSTPPRGMLPGANPRIGTQLQLTDVGGAGILTAWLQYCQDDGWTCLYLSGSSLVRGQAAGSVLAGDTIWPGQPLGTYRLTSVELVDWAGNYRTYGSIDTDLGQFIANPTILVTE